MNIRPEEFKPVVMLIGFSFLTGLSMSFYFTASNAIFLQEFDPRVIPVSFIASGVLIYLAWRLFSITDCRFSFATQIQAKMGFTFITVLLISLGVLYYKKPWLVFIMYTWVRIVVYLTLVSFWGIAGKMFNIRQGKRIFGLIGVGEVVSIMIGYFSIPFILKILKAADLLFLATGTLLLCYVIARIILSVFKDQLVTAKAAVPVSKNTAVEQKQTETNYRKLIKQPYFLLMSAMALLPIFGYLFVDFLFLAQTKKEFANNPQTVAGFLGIFLGFVALVELVMKLVSGRFLNKYGIKYSLVILPLILGATTLIAALTGTLYGAVGLFFTFIVLARLFERSVRSAVYEPAFQLLYQPVPVEQRLIFQNQIEGIPKALGTVITGLSIVVFSAFPFFNLVHYSWFYLLVLILWVWVALKMYDSYRNTIRAKLNESDVSLNDQSAAETPVLTDILKASGESSFARVYRICYAIDPYATDQVLKTAEEQDNWIVGREQLLQYIQRQEQPSAEVIAHLCRSENVNDRIEAALQLSTSARYNTIRLLLNLSKDHNKQVRKQALIAAGKIKRHELWPFVLESLSDVGLSHLAILTALQIGEPLMKELERLFEKPATSTAVRINIIAIWEKHNSPTTVKLLAKRLSHPDKEVQKQVVIALSNRQYKPTATETSLLKDLLDVHVEYLTWLIASLRDLAEEPEAFDLKMSLLSEEERLKEYLFKILALLYDEKSIGNIRRNIESKDANTHVYAMEIADMTISNEIKEIFIPIFEDLTLHEKLHRLRFRFPQPELNAVERCMDIINAEYWKSNRYSKACALKMLAGADKKFHNEITSVLAANIVHSDAMLSELATYLLRQYDEDFYRSTVERMSKIPYDKVRQNAEKIATLSMGNTLLMTDKINQLKQTEYFAAFDETVLLDLLDKFPDVDIVSRHSPIRSDAIPADDDRELIPLDRQSSLAIPVEALNSLIKSDREFAHKIFKMNRELQHEVASDRNIAKKDTL